MGAVAQTIPNLLGGVSQQADPIKLAGQVKESINAYLDPTFGCRKRPPLQFVKNLASNINPLLKSNKDLLQILTAVSPDAI